MSSKHLSRLPMQIDSDNWYYEEPGGIVLIHMQPAINDKNMAVGKTAAHIKISWRKLRASLRRKDIKN